MRRRPVVRTVVAAVGTGAMLIAGTACGNSSGKAGADGGSGTSKAGVLRFATFTVPMGATAYYGFAVTAHDTTQLNTAVFTDPSVR